MEGPAKDHGIVLLGFSIGVDDYTCLIRDRNSKWQIEPGQAHITFHMTGACASGSIVEKCKPIVNFYNRWQSNTLF